jgi:NAD(P)-dependent dehydrogenase (short-subunit alcohol dehydrogenase family)
LNAIAVVIGASGGIGSAVADLLETSNAYHSVIRLSRSSDPVLDLTDEQSVETAAAHCEKQGELRLVFNATGFLHGGDIQPEKALKQLSVEAMEKNFRLNAVGPALVMKHFLPLLPREGRSMFATVTAKVGSISDNKMGGWHSYRASKAAHNQFLRCAAIEMARTHGECICVALHPGTVESDLSEPFAKSGLKVRPPEVAAREMLTVLDQLSADQSGGFFGYDGAEIGW